jgi:hypothetical protein
MFSREETMPSIFKALSSIVAWILFIFGFLRLIIALVMAFTTGRESPALAVYLDFAVAISSLALSVVVMWLRKKLD